MTILRHAGWRAGSVNRRRQMTCAGRAGGRRSCRRRWSLQDPQVGDAVGQGEVEACSGAYRGEGMQFLAWGFGEVEFAGAGPRVGDGLVVVDGHDEFVDGWLVLLACSEVREVTQVH